MTKQSFSLTVAADTELVIRAEDSGRTWNGYAVPILTAEQALIVSAALCEHIDAGPAEGLTWTLTGEPCGACGMVHTAEHSCEPLTTYGS